MLNQFYGGHEEMTSNLDSFLINITKVPANLTAQAIRDYISKDKSPFIKAVCARIVVFDIFNAKETHPELYIEGSLSRQETYDCIEQMAPLAIEEEKLQTALSGHDVDKLTNLSKKNLRKRYLTS